MASIPLNEANRDSFSVSVKGVHWWTAPIYQKQWNRPGLNSRIGSLGVWYTSTFMFRIRDKGFSIVAPNWVLLHGIVALPGETFLIAVRRQDENSLLALHYLTTGHAFDWTRASAVGNGTTKWTRKFIEAWKTTPTWVNQCTTIDPCYKALRAYWKRKRT